MSVFRVKDSNAIVRVKNVMRAGHIHIQDDDKPIILPAGRTAEITWKTWVKCQDDKTLSRLLRLDDSVTITEDGEILLYGLPMKEGEEVLTQTDIKTYFALPITVFADSIKDFSVTNLNRLLSEAVARGREDFIKVIKPLIPEDSPEVEANVSEEETDLPEDISPRRTDSIIGYE